MKKTIIICLTVLAAGCGIYKPYTRPEISTEGLYGSAESADTATFGNVAWREVFTDPQLQALIAEALENNTDMQSAHWRVKEAEASLRSARLAYLPSFNFAPQGRSAVSTTAPPPKPTASPSRQAGRSTSSAD